MTTAFGEWMYDYRQRERAKHHPTLHQRIEDARYTIRRYVEEHSKAFKAIAATILSAMPITIFSLVTKKPTSNCEKLHGPDATQAKCSTEAIINDKIEKDVAQANKTISDQQKREDVVAVIYENGKNYIQTMRQCSNAAVQAKKVCDKKFKDETAKYNNTRMALIVVPAFFYILVMALIFFVD